MVENSPSRNKGRKQFASLMRQKKIDKFLINVLDWGGDSSCLTVCLSMLDRSEKFGIYANKVLPISVTIDTLASQHGGKVYRYGPDGHAPKHEIELRQWQYVSQEQNDLGVDIYMRTYIFDK